MKIELTNNNKRYICHLDKPINLAIPMKDGDNNPNCFWGEPPSFSTIRMGDFVGSVKEGGNVNYQRVSFTPHGNGTHTECYGHITDDEDALLTNSMDQFHFIAKLITITPAHINEDLVVTFEEYLKALDEDAPEAVIIRTLPNGTDKLKRQYSGSNPPYLDPLITEHMAKQYIKHLLLDLPSVDREQDEGKLTAHKNFWNINGVIRKSCTITELIYVPDTVGDGIYLLNLQVPNMAIDAAPSRPTIYLMEEVIV